MEIKKNLFQAASAHALCISFLAGIVAAVFLGLDKSLALAEANVRESLAVFVFLQPSVSDAQARLLMEALRSRDRDILSIAYHSREEAIQEAQKDVTLAKALLVLKENPLPSSLRVTYDDPAWLQRSAPLEIAPDMPEIQEIRWDASARSVFRSLHQWRQWFWRISALSAGLLGVGSFFGLYRFWVQRPPLAQLAWPLVLGVFGGALGVLVWTGAINQLGADAMAYRPASPSYWPILAGAIGGLACAGFGAAHEG